VSIDISGDDQEHVQTDKEKVIQGGINLNRLVCFEIDIPVNRNICPSLDIFAWEESSKRKDPQLIGYGTINLRSVLEKLTEELQHPEADEELFGNFQKLEEEMEKLAFAEEEGAQDLRSIDEIEQEVRL